MNKKKKIEKLVYDSPLFKRKLGSGEVALVVSRAEVVKEITKLFNKV